MVGAGFPRGAGRQIAPARLAQALAGPIAIAAGSAAILALMIGDMSAIPGMGRAMNIGPMQVFGLFLMWAVMMAAMMLPTAAPMIVAYARMQAADRMHGASSVPVFMFSGGYVVAWAGFSLAAALLQAGLANLAFLSPMTMKAVSGPLAGGILVVAGLYQFSPLKQSCLRHCRTPIGFLMTERREGAWGALTMGWRHGLFCVGCCWALMGLLFVVGVMNPVWIVAIAFYVLAEKIVAGGETFSKIVGACLVGAGVWMVL